MPKLLSSSSLTRFKQLKLPKQLIITTVVALLVIGGTALWQYERSDTPQAAVAKTAADTAPDSMLPVTEGQAAAGDDALLQTVQPQPPATAVSPAASWPQPAPAATLAGGSLGLSVSAEQVRVGDKLTVGLFAASGQTAINSVQAVITYDPSVLEYVSTDTAGAFTVTAATDSSSAGTLRIARAAGTAVTGQQAVAAVHFSVKAGQGPSSLAISAADSLLVQADSPTNILRTVSGARFSVN